MSDQRDPRIRALIVELSESSPEAPTFAEIADCAAEPVGTGAVRSPVAARPRRGWAFGVAAVAAVVALLLIGGPLFLLRDSVDTEIEPLAPVVVETTVTIPTTAVPPTTETTLGEVRPGVVWTGPVDPITLALDPAVVPAEIGTVTVTVTGRSHDFTVVWVCPGARGVVDAADWPGSREEVGVHEFCDSTEWAVQPTFEFGTFGEFEATLEVPIDAQAIEDGGVVIATGDMWAVLRGTVLLQIADDAAVDDATEGLDTDDPAIVTAPPETTTPTAAPHVGSTDTFEWEMHELDESITYPARWRDGYVAVRGDRVASSTDGVRWEAWPEQPVELIDSDDGQLALAVIGGDVVVVVAQPNAPILAFESDGEEPWREIAFDPVVVTSVLSVLELILSQDDDLYVRPGTFVRQADGFVITQLPENPDFGLRWNQVGDAWNRITPPDDTRVVGEKGGRFTAFTWPERGETWTSIDGFTWRSIEPVAVPFSATDCSSSPSVPAITPQVVETGGLGWFAAGSYCAPTVVWYSPDGVQWQTIDNIEGLSDFGIFLPISPLIVVDEQRVLIYGILDDDMPGRPNWAVWIGTPQTDD